MTTSSDQLNHRFGIVRFILIFINIFYLGTVLDVHRFCSSNLGIPLPSIRRFCDRDHLFQIINPLCDLGFGFWFCLQCMVYVFFLF